MPGGANAAACGRDRAHVTLLVGEALPDGLPREQLEAMMAHLVGSIANGDMTIGLRVTTTLATFGLIARVGGAFADRRRFRRTAKLWSGDPSCGSSRRRGNAWRPWRGWARTSSSTCS